MNNLYSQVSLSRYFLLGYEIPCDEVLTVASKHNKCVDVIHKPNKSCIDKLITMFVRIVQPFSLVGVSFASFGASFGAS